MRKMKITLTVTRDQIKVRVRDDEGVEARRVTACFHGSDANDLNIYGNGDSYRKKWPIRDPNGGEVRDVLHRIEDAGISLTRFMETGKKSKKGKSRG